MSGRSLGEAVLAWAARIGPFWYAIPSVLVIVAGIGTCSLIDEPDHDTFTVVRSLLHPSATRAAVVARQRHADSGATVTCVWLVIGPAPSAGPTRRLGESCALIATDPEIRLDLAWLPSGRLGVKLPAGTGHTAIEPIGERCYFERDRLGRHVCYRPRLVEVEP